MKKYSNNSSSFTYLVRDIVQELSKPQTGRKQPQKSMSCCINIKFLKTKDKKKKYWKQSEENKTLLTEEHPIIATVHFSSETMRPEGNDKYFPSVERKVLSTQILYPAKIYFRN